MNLRDLFEYKSIFILYMLISANFLANTFGCSIQKILTENMLAKHLIGFLTLYFFVTLTSKPDKTDELMFIKKFSVSILVYFVFILSTRTKGMYFNIFLLLVAVNFLINSYTDSIDETKHQEYIDTVKYFGTWLGRIAMIVLVLGLMNYYLVKRYEYGSDFNIFTFIIGRPSCKSMN